MREADERYFARLEDGLEEAMDVASRARERGGDPRPEVEIPVARDMADRVENILGIDGVAERVRELEGQMSREEAALELVEDFVDGTVGDYDSRAGKIEGAVRTAVALLTEGVVAAPIEGIDRVELLENDDGTEFVNVYYAGPIRSAGGTAQALSVLVADYARTLLGIEQYRAREEEIGRYAEEIDLYDQETGLQYTPEETETTFIAEHMPIMLDGEATGDEEVSGYRDLERVDSDAARGGMCLVLAEGIALKAPKIQRYTRDLEGVEWPWLQDLIDGTIGASDGEAGETGESDDGDGAGSGSVEGPPRPDPSKKYLRDLIAGRPVFGHPSEPGGFRLRYGRARNHGFATAGVHPATMHLVDDFLATGTQIKTERPGKAAGVVPVDAIEGPTVRLANGDVRRIDDPEEALAVRNGVEKIIDLGEYLVNYGEFVENNYPLAPAAYTVEWWVQEFARSGADVQAMRDAVDVDLADPSGVEALEWAREHDAPLHPKYTYCWHDVSVEAVEALAQAVEAGEVTATDGAEPERSHPPFSTGDTVLVLPRTGTVRETLESLLVEHTQREERLVVPDWKPLARTLGFDDDRRREWAPEDLSGRARGYDGGANAIEAVNEVAPFRVRERAPTRVGNRMGRPEKSEERELSPAVHTLFPIGEAGGPQRDVAEAAAHAESMRDRPGEVEVEIARRECRDCGTETHEARCPACGGVARAVYVCPDCDREVDPDESGRAECPRCATPARPTRSTAIDVDEVYRSALETVGERESAFDVLKGVKGLSSEQKVPEPMEKGVLRAKHDVSAFKDGTVRYDMTDLPVTSVRPAELDVTVEQFRELGYETDRNGDPLRHDDQLVELKIQDVVLSDGAAEHMLRTAEFVDDLLRQYYGLPAFYDLEDRSDLVGELVFGMAPHTSAATVGRVVGFTSAAVGYAHPYFHAAKRRNCFAPDTRLWYREDGEWALDSIETLVEDHLTDPREDALGALVDDPDGDLVVPSLDGEGAPARKPVEAVSKHPAPDHLVRVETGGSTLSVTPDHTMLRREDGTVVECPASALEPGAEVPAFDGGETTTTGGRPTDAVPFETVEDVSYVEYEREHVYCLTVEEANRVAVEGLYTGQCDGDEDCVMLLMDGLLNFSKLYLPDQRGGSVAENSRLVAVDPDDNVRFMTFEEFWAELASPVETDGKFRKRTCYSEGWRTYAFDDSHEAALRPIEKAIRYRADEDETLVRVETQSGRSIDITEHHSLFRYDDGIEQVAGGDLRPGDLVVAPRELPIEPEPTTVDVAEALEEPYVCVDEGVEDLLRTVRESTQRGSEANAAIDRGLSEGKIAFDRLSTVLDHGGFEVPRDVEIGFRGSSPGIDRTVEVDENFAWLLGLFLAGGRTSSVDPRIHSADGELIDRAAAVATEKSGTEPGRRSSGRAYELRFPAVFREVLHSLCFEDAEPHGSGESVVPGCILGASRDVALSFLRGYAAGDGSDGSDDSATTVAFHTTSDGVRDGIVFLLHRLGLVADVSTKTDREADGQDTYAVTVSGGGNDDPLDRILDGAEPCHPGSPVVPTPDAEAELDGSRPLVDGDLSYLRVESVEAVEYDGYLYDLQVGGDPVFTANWLYAHNSMDAPLVMSSRIDPSEIDDEAHNMDIMREYPLEFYEATREMADPGDVADLMTIAEETLGTDDQYRGFDHTHDTADLALGPDLSAYKTLGSMEEKMDAQLALARKLRAVDETDVAERIIEYHFLPDLIGNLRAFSRQDVRCLDCGESYRRAPLSGDCRKCGGRVNLTVHEGSVTKYIDTATEVAEEFGCREYTKQRLEILERSIERVFENDHNKQSGIADFM